MTVSAVLFGYVPHIHFAQAVEAKWALLKMAFLYGTQFVRLTTVQSGSTIPVGYLMKKKNHFKM